MFFGDSKVLRSDIRNGEEWQRMRTTTATAPSDNVNKVQENFEATRKMNVAMRGSRGTGDFGTPWLVAKNCHRVYRNKR